MKAKNLKGVEACIGEEVQVYKNLHKNCYSIKQNGRVVAYAAELGLRDVKFKVSQAGRKRVLEEKRKNVHAYIMGKLTIPQICKRGTKVTYNPYRYDSFVQLSTPDQPTSIYSTSACRLSETGVICN